VIYNLIKDGKDVSINEKNKESCQNHFLEWWLRKSVLPRYGDREELRRKLQMVIDIAEFGDVAFHIM
jgi:hypothetical protein